MPRILSILLLSFILTACATLQDKENQEAIAEGVSTFLMGYIK